MTAAPVLVGVDGSEESRLALRWAFEYAQMSGAPVEAVIAWEIPPTYGLAPSYDDVDFEKKAQETAEETIRAVVGDNAPVTVRLSEGIPPRFSLPPPSMRNCWWSVHGATGAFAGMLLGSVSQHCVHQAHCPVVVIRRPKGESHLGR